MTILDIPQMRLKNQGISDRRFKTVKEVVSWMGAMQAQDYNASLWAIGLRMAGNPKVADIEKAISKGEIIRLWPMRGTIHFVAAEDARWMHSLLTPRLNNTYNDRSDRLGITPEIIKQSKDLFTKALKGNKHLTREALYQILEKAGIKTANSIGLHITYRLAHEGLIVCGPREGKQQTLALFDEWVPKGKEFSREEAIKELTLRYFTSHGPAQIKDLNWWSGLPIKDIKRGIELNGKKLTKETIEGKDYYFSALEIRPIRSIRNSQSAFLLPAFDEYIVAYRDRDAVLESVHKEKINPGGNGMLQPVVVINGQVLGNWKKVIKKSTVEVVTVPFVSFGTDGNVSIKIASEQYNFFNKLTS
ncbi:MAG: AlkZ family DNA glycosylase [Candidatus Pacebacteria bacterium]|nr:AlkZ family DNA glycosylase [Candidatus Paceibacterota bacterium]